MENQDTFEGQSIEDIVSDAGVEPAPETAPEPASESAPEPTAEEKARYSYKALGKDVEEDIDTILQRASMGYDYAQKMDTFKKEKAEWEQKYQQAQEMEQKWKHLDDYARENPEWHEHVQQNYNNRFQQQQPDSAVDQANPAMQEISRLREKLGEFESFKQEMLNLQQKQQQSQEDQMLAGEIKSIQEKYPNIDFSATDPMTGKSLEFQVLEHANQTGITNFRAAFRDFYHDRLVEMARSEAKDKLANSVKESNKSGLLGKTQAPTQGLQDAGNVSGKSYEALMEEALAELKI